MLQLGKGSVVKRTYYKAMRTRLPLRKEAGVVIHVCNLSNVGDRDRSSGLAGCQPRPKHANSSFQERPCPDRVSSDRSRQTSDTVLWLPLTHTGTPVCHIYHMHYPYTYTWREGEKSPGETLPIQLITGIQNIRACKKGGGIRVFRQWRTKEEGMIGAFEICETTLEDQIYEWWA